MYHVAMNLRRIAPIRSGVEAYMHGLTDALARRDDVIVHGIVPFADLPLPARVRRVVQPLPAAAGLYGKVWYDFIASGRAAAALSAPIYHGVDTFLPVGIAKATRCVVNVHDLGYFRHPELFDRKTRLLNQWHARLRMQRADHIVALSTLTADDLMALLGTAAARITVIPAAHDDYFFPDPASPSDTDPFFLAVGGSNPRKNLDRVASAFGAWRARSSSRRDTWLRVVGGIDARMQARAEQLRDEHVVLEGFVTRDRLRTLYRSTRGLIFPALYEGFGIPILEAMACGAAVLTTGSGATRDVAGDAAVGVDATDVRSIEAGIERLDRERESLRTAGLARAAQFSWDATAALTAEVYGHVSR